MDIYFHCSYQNSVRGYCPAMLTEDGLVPCQQLPEAADEFFDYDRYQVLWKDLCEPGEDQWRDPTPRGSFLGIRGLKGAFADGRMGMVNLAFLAEGSEQMNQLHQIGLRILGDINGFEAGILSMLSVGGLCSYQLDGQRFQAWLTECTASNRLKVNLSRTDPAVALLKYMNRRNPPKRATELLRFAVCTCDWKNLRDAYGRHLLWKIKPASAIYLRDFEILFLNRGILWELESSQLTQDETNTE